MAARPKKHPPLANVKAGSVGTPSVASASPEATRGKPDEGVSTHSLTPYGIFLLCIKRAENLLKIHQAAHGKQSKPQAYLADAHRASVVLSISALDAYIRTFLIHKILKMLAEQHKILPSALGDEIRKFIKEDELLEAARKHDLSERVEKAFRSDFEKRSFQGVKHIETGMRMVGITDIFEYVASKGSFNEKEIKLKLNDFTNRRHLIAHAGDYNLSQNPAEENKITKKYACSVETF